MGTLLPVWLVSLSDGALPPSSVTSGANANANFSPRRRRSNVPTLILRRFLARGGPSRIFASSATDGRRVVECRHSRVLAFVRTPFSLPPHIPSTTIFHKIGLLRTAPNRLAAAAGVADDRDRMGHVAPARLPLSLIPPELLDKNALRFPFGKWTIWQTALARFALARASSIIILALALPV